MSEDDTAEDEDWFESALGEDVGQSSGDFGDEAGDVGGEADDTDGEAGGSGGAANETGGESSDSGVSEADSSRTPTDADAFAESGGGGEGGFDGAVEDALGDEVDSPFGDTGASSPFGDADTGGGAFGGGSAGSGGGGDLFDEGFEDAMGSMGGGGETEFDDAELDSDIPRIDVGIEGLDNMIQGGVPMRHLIVIIGGAGTGKTTFGLQFLRHGLEKEDTDKGVFITLEQTYEDIVATAAERDWEFARHEEEGTLAVIDLDPIEMANSLDNIRGELPHLIEGFDADRFVLDSVSLLEMMYDEQARRRTEVFDFTQSLKAAGVTTVLTSEAAEDNPYASRHGIIEYLTDAVFLLRYVRSETTETRLAVEIQKIRNANHSRETKPYEITLDGIDVYEQANIF